MYRCFSNNKYSYKKLFIKSLIISVFIGATATVFLHEYFEYYPKVKTENEIELENIEGLNIKLENDVWIPDGGDNITGWPRDIVPNILHYVLFEEHKISYIHMLSMMSVVRIQKPKTIYIHCDCDKMDDGDINWARVLSAVNETNEITIIINQIEKPTEIFGRKVSEGSLNFHASDITRYRSLIKYGGIYIDNDVFVCQPLDRFFKFEFTINWDVDQFMGSQVLIANRNARFLKFIMETYKLYDANQWYYNAGVLPTKAVLFKYPHLVHRILVKFGVDAPGVCPYFYKEYHENWQTEFYTFHMVARGDEISWKDWCLGGDDHYMRNVKFTDDLIKSLNNTFGEMGRLVLFGAKNLPEEISSSTSSTSEATSAASESSQESSTSNN